MSNNPIKTSIDCLVELGFTREQARNICGAIRADSPEKLLHDAPIWLEWCGRVKRDHDCIVMIAATGLVSVELGPGGIDDLRMSLIGFKDDKRMALNLEVGDAE